jgi:hypothetical protein
VQPLHCPHLALHEWLHCAVHRNLSCPALAWLTVRARAEQYQPTTVQESSRLPKARDRCFWTAAQLATVPYLAHVTGYKIPACTSAAINKHFTPLPPYCQHLQLPTIDNLLCSCLPVPSASQHHYYNHHQQYQWPNNSKIPGITRTTLTKRRRTNMPT